MAIQVAFARDLAPEAPLGKRPEALYRVQLRRVTRIEDKLLPESRGVLLVSFAVMKADIIEKQEYSSALVFCLYLVR